jgi:hypothetical protein
MQRTLYIGIDDTDVLGGPGTGRVARGLAQRLESLGLGSCQGIIRHQLLVDPRIPCTSHNSAKCILFETDKKTEDFKQPCTSYILENFQPGSDPGLCLCEMQQFSDQLYRHGLLAQEDYIPKTQAYELAHTLGIYLEELGGTGDGVVGALAAVALSMGGNDGRYVHLQGIKEIQGLVTVAQVKQRTGTVCVIDGAGHLVPDDEIIDSMGWLRPSRLDGQPKLRVAIENSQQDTTIWKPIERKIKTHNT